MTLIVNVYFDPHRFGSSWIQHPGSVCDAQTVLGGKKKHQKYPVLSDCCFNLHLIVNRVLLFLQTG